MFTIRMRVDNGEEKRYKMKTVEPEETEETEERSENNVIDNQDAD